MQQIITVIISIAVFVFFVANHFKKQRIDKKIFIPFIIFTLLSIECYIRYQSLHLVVMGLMPRFIMGAGIGILQGMLIYYKESYISLIIYILVIAVKWYLRLIGTDKGVIGGGLVFFACGSLIGWCSYISYKYLCFNRKRI